MIAFDEIIINNNSSSSYSEESKKPWCSYTIMLIHGLLGCGNDFAEFAHSLASSLSSSTSHLSADWRMVLVDLRNHGRSTDIGGLLPPHDLENAARDLSNLVKSHNWAWPDVVIGHSLGGKVALQYTLSCARGDYGESAQVPKLLWVLDVTPGKIENSLIEELVKALHTLHTLPSPILSQEWLVDHMINLGFSKFLSEWIGNSVKKSGEHVRLSFNVEGALQMFNSARIMDYWGLLEHPPMGIEMALVRTDSQLAWQPDVVERLDSLAKRETDESTCKFSVHVVPGSGHWIYRDEPETLLEIMTPKIVSLLQPKLYNSYSFLS